MCAAELNGIGLARERRSLHTTAGRGREHSRAVRFSARVRSWRRLALGSGACTSAMLSDTATRKYIVIQATSCSSSRRAGATPPSGPRRRAGLAPGSGRGGRWPHRRASVTSTSAHRHEHEITRRSPRRTRNQTLAHAARVTRRDVGQARDQQRGAQTLQRFFDHVAEVAGGQHASTMSRFRRPRSTAPSRARRSGRARCRWHATTRASSSAHCATKHNSATVATERPTTMLASQESNSISPRDVEDRHERNVGKAPT